MPVLVLYGPPAAGKDTITRELHRLDPRYELYRPLRSGEESPRYRHLSAESGGEAVVLHKQGRYGRRYVFDRQGINALHETGRIPVVHLSQVVGVDAIRHAYPATVSALIWCSLAECRRRLAARGDTDAEARIVAWRETADDLAAHRNARFTLTVDTDATGPDAAAVLLRASVEACRD